MEKLYKASLKGDVEKLEALVLEDELILAQVSISSCYNQTPLHLASMLGHFEFAKSLLFYKPDFASRLDSQDRSPLHLASANGYANIVKLLVENNREMCRVRDEDGRTPLHLAVMNGQHESVVELIKVDSKCYDEEGTVLHLCVMYNRLNLLVHLLESNYQNLCRIKDGNGNTVLHSAAALKRMQIIKYLVKSGCEVDVHAVNQNGLTAVDIIDQMPKDVRTMEIKELLISTTTSKSKEITKAENTAGLLMIPAETEGENIQLLAAATATVDNKMVSIWKKVKIFVFQEKLESDERLLVAASVIAAMAYQAVISPPGGVAGIDAKEQGAALVPKIVIAPAESLLAIFHPELSKLFWKANTISFICALSVIFLYVSGATLKRRFFIWLIRAAMWITLSSMAVAYVCAVQATNPVDYFTNGTIHALIHGVEASMGLLLLPVLVLAYRCLEDYIVKPIMKKRASKAAVLDPRV